MQQELKGFFVALCPTCRYREPVSVGNMFHWYCHHRQTTVVETADRRLLTIEQGATRNEHTFQRHGLEELATGAVGGQGAPTGCQARLLPCHRSS
ncbi:MAG: hypothetical protein JSS38_01520 [Nitrospira sp.]|nr:hypothetical protein [Nitrospira sp.]